MKRYLTFCMALAVVFSCAPKTPFSGDMDMDDIHAVCDAVAQWQIDNYDRTPRHVENNIIMNQVHWSTGVLYTGLFDWAQYTRNESYFEFIRDIGEQNEWGLIDFRTPYHADDICVGQAFIRMAERYNEPEMMEAVRERGYFIATHPSTAPLSKKDQIGQYDRWSWCDAIFMAPPVYASLYRVTGDNVYREYMENEFRECTDSLYDREDHLYFRDCIRRENTEPNGAKEFWARGNAWVFSGIALTLNNLTPEYAERAYFEQIFSEMAVSIVKCQGEDGSWRPSLLDPEHFPTPENSSSSLFCYGLAWGINHGVLDVKTYMPALRKGWKALCSHVHEDGKLGFVQPIGAFPLGGITADDTQVYAVGGFLLAGAEISRLITKPGTSKEVNPVLCQPKVENELTGILRNKVLSETDNDLTIGCEVLDRDYADYHCYKTYLEPLGMRRLRLQAGWAKTEKVKGEYDFAWLDSIVDDAVSRGLIPWIQTSYGNPIYEGGGTPYLAGGWPTSDEAKEAWDNWVRAMAERYKGKVTEWEIWNEPDINKEQFKDYLSFVEMTVRTAKVIRSVQPEAKIAAFAWAYSTPELFDECLSALQESGNLDLIDWVTYHFYRYRPEDIFVEVDKLQAVLDKYDTDIKLRQGETGAPSAGRLGGALDEYDWTEVSQGKWDIRRMLTDKSRNIPTTVFTISDFTYSKKDHINKKNVKGLLKTDDSLRITRPKQSYFAVRNLATLWDEMDIPAEKEIACSSEESLSLHAFRDAETGLESFVVWKNAGIPDDCVETDSEEFTVADMKIKDPVCVDIRTGNIYKVEYTRKGKAVCFKDVPLYDSPVLVIDSRLVERK